jgi:hypothetical protein
LILGDEAERTALTDTPAEVVVLASRGQNDIRAVGCELPGDVEAARIRQRNVQKDELGPELLGQRQRCLPIGRFAHDGKPFELQERSRGATKARVIVDNYH